MYGHCCVVTMHGHCCVVGTVYGQYKRKALSEMMEAAVILMDDIFGAVTKKPWTQHPRYQELKTTAADYVDRLGFSQPEGGSSETMHTLARKLPVKLPVKKTPSKPILAHAIVVQKLRQSDATATLTYE